MRGSPTARRQRADAQRFDSGERASRRGKAARSLFGETMIECRDWSRTVETESVVVRSCPRANAHRLAKTKSVGEPVAVRPRTTRNRRNDVNGEIESSEGERPSARQRQEDRGLTPSGSTAARGSRRGKAARSLFGETMIECRDWSRTVETESVVVRSCPRANAHRLAQTKSVREPVAVRPRTTRNRQIGRAHV